MLISGVARMRIIVVVVVVVAVAVFVIVEWCCFFTNNYCWGGSTP